MVEAVERADRRVHRAVEVEGGKVLAEPEDFPRALGRSFRQHVRAAVHPDHVVAEAGKLDRKAPRPARQIEQDGLFGHAEMLPDDRIEILRAPPVVDLLHQPVVIGGKGVVGHQSFTRSKTTL